MLSRSANCFAVPVAMPDGLWPILILIAILVAWIVAKIRFYIKKSEAEWREVDKSKLREWEDDED